MGRTRLSLMKDITPEMSPKKPPTWPPTVSLMAGAAPLYGTCRISALVAILSSEIAIWGMLPIPEEAKVALPGYFFALSRNSACDLMWPAAGPQREKGDSSGGY